MKKTLLIGVAVGAIIIVCLATYFIYSNHQEQKRLAQEKLEMEAKKELDIKKEIAANREFLISVVDALSELDSFRDRVISGKDDMKTSEIGKLLEVHAHRGLMDIGKYSSSDYKNIKELSIQLTDVFTQLEDYGTDMNINPSKNFNDLSVVLNDLPDNIRIVIDYLYNGKIELDDDSKSEVLLRLNVHFKDELELYEKYLVSRSEKDFGAIFSEDLTAIFMSDILLYGRVRLSK